MEEAINNRKQGLRAQEANIQAGQLIYNLMKSTLGPKGMDKMILNSAGKIIITNDGVTILNEMQIGQPAAKMIAEAAQTQEEEIGDGTTTVAMLAGKLLENAGELIKKNVHPTTISKGYILAMKKCKELLEELAIKDLSEDQLRSISSTALTGKGAEEHKDLLSDLVVRAVIQAKEKENVKIERVKGKSIEESELIEGMVLPNPVLMEGMPKKVKHAKILLADFDLQVKNPEMDIQAQVTTPEQLRQFTNSDRDDLDLMMEKIKSSGANVIICQKGIDDYIQQRLVEEGIMAIRRIAKQDMDQLALATGGTLCPSIDNVNEESLGKAELVEEEKNKEGSLTYVRGCPNKNAVCILLCGTTSHVLDEIRRAVTDSLGDVFDCYIDKKAVPGGGAIEMALSKRLIEYSMELSGREQLAVRKFADALESIPEALADNAGLDSINILTEMRNQHQKSSNYGLNLFTNKIEDTLKAG
ncbi:MAG TPA: thermosome subunit, partial [Candidatus Scalindua sp.]|nr:thermosome subunit [Candidatus Scalindua sp.]